MAALREGPRNKGFDTTHAEMIQAAVALMSEKGADAVTIAGLARAMKIERTTVYYHFENRDALIAAVKACAAEELAKAFTQDVPQQERIDTLCRFVLENPDLITLWIEDFVSPGDIRTRYPQWDTLVDALQNAAGTDSNGEKIDAEVFGVVMVASAIIGPRVFKNSVRPKEDTEAIVQRFRSERQRLLKWLTLLGD